MSAEEILRRLRALVAMKPHERPVSIYSIETVAGLTRGAIYEIVEQATIREQTRLRLERALTWVENDQVKITKRPNRLADITITPPRPPQMTVRVVKFTEAGPRIRSFAYNPRSFPAKTGGSNG